MTEDQNFEQEFDLDLIDKAFEEKYSQHDLPNPLKEEQEKPKKVEDKNPVKDPEEDEDEVEEKPIDKKAKDSKASEEKEEAQLKQAYSKLEKSYKDTQKAFHEDRKKLSAYRRAVQSMVDDGVLTEEESQILMDHTKFEGSSTADIQHNTSVPGVNFSKYANVIGKELELMERYSSNPQEIRTNTQSFQHLFDTSSWEEKQNILDELEGFEDDPVELTKQMLLLGARHNDEVYSEIRDAGSIKQLKQKYNAEIEILQKKLDKSEKQYNKLKQKYEDYNEPTSVTVPGGSSDGRSSRSDTFSGGSEIDAALNWAYGGRR